MNQTKFRKAFLSLEPRDFDELEAITEQLNRGRKLTHKQRARVRRLKAVGLLFPIQRVGAS